MLRHQNAFLMTKEVAMYWYFGLAALPYGSENAK